MGGLFPHASSPGSYNGQTSERKRFPASPSSSISYASGMWYLNVGVGDALPVAFRAAKQRQETPLHSTLAKQKVCLLLDAPVSAIRARPPLERGADKVPRTRPLPVAPKAVYAPRTGTKGGE